MIKKLLYSYKPSVPKRYLLLIAGLVWTFAGCMLFLKGTYYLVNNTSHLLIRYLIAVPFGITFYLVLFAKISLKHINRIRTIDIARPCLFSFFNFRSYIMMGVMMSMGIMLRRFDVIDHDILYTFYLGMGTPLLISAARFYFAWAKFKQLIPINNE